MESISWVSKKDVDFTHLQSILQDSILTNHFTNGGPCVKKLEEYLTLEWFCLPHNKKVIAVANGCVGLHAIIQAYELRKGGPLQWATQSFTFPSAAQGPLASCVEIVDIEGEENVGPNLSQVDPAKIDGIILTNVFGCVANISKYENWCAKHGKLLVLDNAATSATFYKEKNSCLYGDASMVSFHHTKPIGFGEGGAVIVSPELEPYVRRVINFGYDVPKGDIVWNPLGSNYKMSDVSAAFILSYMKRQRGKLLSAHNTLLTYFKKKLGEDSILQNRVHLLSNYSSSEPFLACFPLVFDTPIYEDDFRDSHVYVRKYYKPLRLEGKALDLYERILCFPCHSDMTTKNIDYILSLIKQKCKKE